MVKLVSLRSAVSKAEYESSAHQATNKHASKNLVSDNLPFSGGTNLVSGSHYANIEKPEDYGCSIAYARQNYEGNITLKARKGK